MVRHSHKGTLVIHSVPSSGQIAAEVNLSNVALDAEAQVGLGRLLVGVVVWYRQSVVHGWLPPVGQKSMHSIQPAWKIVLNS